MFLNVFRAKFKRIELLNLEMANGNHSIYFMSYNSIIHIVQLFNVVILLAI